jgi:hypothetical protein
MGGFWSMFFGGNASVATGEVVPDDDPYNRNYYKSGGYRKTHRAHKKSRKTRRIRKHRKQ